MNNLFYLKTFLPCYCFGGGGGTPDPPPVEKAVETRRIVEQAGEEREEERKRVPPGRSATQFAGIEKMLKDQLGK